jgi:hypothetical protein
LFDRSLSMLISAVHRSVTFNAFVVPIVASTPVKSKKAARLADDPLSCAFVFRGTAAQPMP